jgi:hypothetical protein
MAIQIQGYQLNDASSRPVLSSQQLFYGASASTDDRDRLDGRAETAAANLY